MNPTHSFTQPHLANKQTELGQIAGQSWLDWPTVWITTKLRQDLTWKGTIMYELDQMVSVLETVCDDNLPINEARDRIANIVRMARAKYTDNTADWSYVERISEKSEGYIKLIETHPDAPRYQLCRTSSHQSCSRPDQEFKRGMLETFLTKEFPNLSTNDLKASGYRRVYRAQLERMQIYRRLLKLMEPIFYFDRPNTISLIGNTYYYFLFAECQQFYLQDEKADADLSWTWQEGIDLLATAQGMIGVGTIASAFVPVEVQILDTEPSDDFAAWDHVTECGVELRSGKLIVAGIGDLHPPMIRLRPGDYRARIYYGGLYSADEPGSINNDDHYKIILWPGVYKTRTVLKRWIDVDLNHTF